MQHFPIKVMARSSPLSRVQVQEIIDLLKEKGISVSFDTEYISTTGDLDLQTSLRSMERTDFFTREIDRAVLKGEARIGIHSAKDLPFPLPKGLQLICLTKGIDPRDALVLKEGVSLDSLPEVPCIATSSVRREALVREILPRAQFIDLRGTIQQRIEKLNDSGIDGVVIAEAALIRLKLTHLHRLYLPGSTTEGQGRLAVVSRTGDQEMEILFRSIHF